METILTCRGCGLIFKTQAADTTELIDTWYHHCKRCEPLVKKEAKETKFMRVSTFFTAIFMVIRIPFAIAVDWVERNVPRGINWVVRKVKRK